jgi:hypothetical protein
MGRKTLDEVRVEDLSNDYTIGAICGADRIIAATGATRHLFGSYVRETQGTLSPEQVRRMVPVLKRTGQGLDAIHVEAERIKGNALELNGFFYGPRKVSKPNERKGRSALKEASERTTRQVKEMNEEGMVAA